MTTLLTKALSRLTSYYNDGVEARNTDGTLINTPRNLMKALIGYAENIEDLNDQVRLARSIDTATGPSLDILGEILGLSRVVSDAVEVFQFGWATDGTVDTRIFGRWAEMGLDGTIEAPTDTLTGVALWANDNTQNPDSTTTLSDSNYRLALKAKIVRNHSNGSLYDTIRGVLCLLGEIEPWTDIRDLFIINNDSTLVDHINKFEEWRPRNSYYYGQMIRYQGQLFIAKFLTQGDNKFNFVVQKQPPLLSDGNVNTLYWKRFDTTQFNFRVVTENARYFGYLGDPNAGGYSDSERPGVWVDGGQALFDPRFLTGGTTFRFDFFNRVYSLGSVFAVLLKQGNIIPVELGGKITYDLLYGTDVFNAIKDRFTLSPFYLPKTDYPTYDPTREYNAGDQVTYNGRLFRALSTILVKPITTTTTVVISEEMTTTTTMDNTQLDGVELFQSQNATRVTGGTTGTNPDVANLPPGSTLLTDVVEVLSFTINGVTYDSSRSTSTSLPASGSGFQGDVRFYLEIATGVYVYQPATGYHAYPDVIETGEYDGVYVISASDTSNSFWGGFFYYVFSLAPVTVTETTPAVTGEIAGFAITRADGDNTLAFAREAESVYIAPVFEFTYDGVTYNRDSSVFAPTNANNVPENVYYLISDDTYVDAYYMADFYFENITIPTGIYNGVYIIRTGDTRTSGGATGNQHLVFKPRDNPPPPYVNLPEIWDDEVNYRIGSVVRVFNRVIITGTSLELVDDYYIAVVDNININPSVSTVWTRLEVGYELDTLGREVAEAYRRGEGTLRIGDYYTQERLERIVNEDGSSSIPTSIPSTIFNRSNWGDITPKVPLYTYKSGSVMIFENPMSNQNTITYISETPLKIEAASDTDEESLIIGDVEVTAAGETRSTIVTIPGRVKIVASDDFSILSLDNSGVALPAAPPPPIFTLPTYAEYTTYDETRAYTVGEEVAFQGRGFQALENTELRPVPANVPLTLADGTRPSGFSGISTGILYTQAALEVVYNGVTYGRDQNAGGNLQSETRAIGLNYWRINDNDFVDSYYTALHYFVNIEIPTGIYGDVYVIRTGTSVTVNGVVGNQHSLFRLRENPPAPYAILPDIWSASINYRAGAITRVFNRVETSTAAFGNTSDILYDYYQATADSINDNPAISGSWSKILQGSEIEARGREVAEAYRGTSDRLRDGDYYTNMQDELVVQVGGTSVNATTTPNNIFNRENWNELTPPAPNAEFTYAPEAVIIFENTINEQKVLTYRSESEITITAAGESDELITTSGDVANTMNSDLRSVLITMPGRVKIIATSDFSIISLD